MKKKVYLGGGDGDLDLTAVGAHQRTVGVDDLDGVVETTVLGQGIKEVLGQVVVLAGSEQLLDTSLLLDTVDGGVLEELTELDVLLDNALDSLQVSLDGIQSLLLGGSGVEGSGVATLNSVKDSGDLFLLVVQRDVWTLGDCKDCAGRSCWADLHELS